MLNREDVLFAIGFDGMNAVVDGSLCRVYKNAASKKLCDDGLFRAAVAAALYDGSDSDLRYVADAYNAAAGLSLSPDALARVFGISLAETIQKAVRL